MLSKLNQQRIKILASKGNDNKTISQKTGIKEKAVKMITQPRTIKQLTGKAVRPIKILKTKTGNRPKSKHLKVREYIESTDTIYAEDMNKLGVAYVTTSLSHYARHNKVKFVQLTHSTWAVER